MAKRSVICHYHIFKNSGTTFEHLLERNFGGGEFLRFDGPFHFSKIGQDELLKVAHNHDVKALSSHQINLPVPTSLEIRFLPVVFVRHPLLRLRSIYRFGQVAPETNHAPPAQDQSFSDWVTECQTSPRTLQVISNAQTRALSAVYGRPAIGRRVPGKGFEMDLDQALRNLEPVEMLARTEFFDQDVARFPEVAEKYGIDFAFTEIEAANTTSTDLSSPLSERLEMLRTEMGSALYEELETLNHQDLALFDYASSRLAA